MASGWKKICFLMYLSVISNFAHARGNGDGFGFAVFAAIGGFFVLWYLGKYLTNSSNASERIFAGFFVFIALVVVFGWLKKSFS
jgi:hypothetical protein